MTRWLVNWFIGRKDYRIPPSCANAVARLLLRSGTDGAMHSEDGYLCFSLPLPKCRAFEAVLCGRRISFEASEHGFHELFLRFKRRPGLLLGGLLFLFIVLSSRGYVWRIDIVGNDRISREELIAELSEQGFELGTKISEVDFDLLHTRLLQEDRRLAWISVNMLGTHAFVELRESELPEKAPDESQPYNLTASEDGIIESIDIYRGSKAAEVGEPIRKGELLASGVMETPNGFKLVHARGVVMANVKRELKLEIPLEYERKVYTGREFKDISIKILGFSLKIFKNIVTLPSNCDIIEEEQRLSFMGVIELPVIVSERTAREYTLEAARLTPDEARRRAFAELRKSCSELDGELAYRELSAGLSKDEESYIIDCRLRVITDIAVETRIY